MAERSLVEWVARASDALTRRAVRHAVVGAIALSVHGYVRATVDIDILIEPHDLPKARVVLQELGFLQTQSKPLHFKRATIVRALVPSGPDGEPLIFDVVMVDERLATSALQRAGVAEINELEVPIVSPEDLVLLKLLRDSDQDRIDIRNLAAQAALDRRYLRTKAKVLRIVSRLNRVLPPRR